MPKLVLKDNYTYCYYLLVSNPTIAALAVKRIWALTYHYANQATLPTTTNGLDVSSDVNQNNFGADQAKAWVSETDKDKYQYYYHLINRNNDNIDTLKKLKLVYHYTHNVTPLADTINVNTDVSAINDNDTKLDDVRAVIGAKRYQYYYQSFQNNPYFKKYKYFQKFNQNTLLKLAYYYTWNATEPKAATSKDLDYAAIAQLAASLESPLSTNATPNQITENQLQGVRQALNVNKDGKTFAQRVNFYAHLLQSEKALSDLPPTLIVMFSYIFGILWQVKLLFTKAEAQQLAVELLKGNGAWMTEEEIEAAELWLSGEYPSAVPFKLVSISSAMALLFIIYTSKRLFKDLPYLWQAIRNPLAKASPATTKRNQRAMRGAAVILALILGATLVGTFGLFVALSDFVAIILTSALTAMGLGSGIVPALVGALALAFVVGYAVHHAIRFYNALMASWSFSHIQMNRREIAHKLNINLDRWDKFGLGNLRLWFATMETNPLLRVKSGEYQLLVEKRSTWHSFSKLFGIVFGIILFPILLSLPVLLPAAYFGYKVFDNILNDLAVYQDSGRNYAHAIVKTLLLPSVVATILAAGPIVVGCLFAAVGIVFCKIIYNHYQVYKSQVEESLFTAPTFKSTSEKFEPSLNELIKRQSAIFQKAKFKLERDNLLSALINWPAKIIAKHLYHYSVFGLITSPFEMVFDMLVTFLWRPLLRLGHFLNELFFTQKQDTGNTYNHLESTSTSKPWFARFKMHFKNFINIINFTEGSEYAKKRNQNNWKCQQAKETIENAHTALSFLANEDKNIELDVLLEGKEVRVKKSNGTQLSDDQQFKTAMTKITCNQELWRLTYERKAKSADKKVWHETGKAALTEHATPEKNKGYAIKAMRY